MEDDRRLLTRWRKGDAEAASALVAAHYPRILNLFYRLTGAREPAEELTQDVFFRLTRQVAGGLEVRELDAWLHRTALNLWRDLARREIRAREKGITASGGDDVLADCRSPDSVEDAVLTDWRRAAVRAAVLGLSPPLREAVVLRHYQGLSYEAIAALTDAPPGTVRSRLFYAMRQLRERLEPDLQRRD